MSTDVGSESGDVGGMMMTPPSMDGTSMHSMNSMSGMDMNDEEHYIPNEDEIYHMSLPWWERTMPGRTGDFRGHFLPAFFFFSVAVWILLVQLKRSWELPPGKTFAEMHIPERCPRLLKKICGTVMVASVLGMLDEGIGGILATGNPFNQLAHLTLYFGYFVIALCGILESWGKLPPDSHRGAFVIALIASFLMWYSHGTMKLFKTDQIIHELLGIINLVNALVMAYSMRYTDSVIAYVAGFALLILQSWWLILAGLYECCYNLPRHEIATYLAVMVIVLTMIIALVVAIFGPEPSEQDKPGFRRQDFSPLQNQSDDDDDDKGFP